MWRHDPEEGMTENCSQFEPIKYVELTAKQKELFNFQKIAAALAEYGYNCIKLADDWQGADFLAYHKDGANTLKVQLKSRVTIHAKYQGKGIWIAFPYENSWYLIDHDRLVDKVREHTDWLETVAWKDNHGYHAAHINADLLKSLAEDRIKPVYGFVLPDENTVASSGSLRN
jgi:hypothetical protein